jgi:hypothetical protein
MTRCDDCGKLFESAPGKKLCDTCARSRMPHHERVREAVEHDGLETPEEIALAVGIPLEDARAILKRLEFARKEVAPDAVCARCRKMEVAHGSPFCAECRAHLDKEFGEAARILEEKIAMAEREQPKKMAGSGMGSREALEKKRVRATNPGNQRR